MTLAFALITNILPLYALIALGFVAGKKLDVDLQSIARLAIFIVSPIVTLGAMTRLNLQAQYLLLPVIVLGFSLLITGLVYNLARWRWRSNEAHLIGLSCVSGNSGYFGLPLVIALYGQDASGLYLLAAIGITISEVTLGYYLAVRGHHDVRESLRRAVRLPALHAVWLGLLLNACHVAMPPVLYTYWTYATGAMVFLGMMMIGVALSRLPRLEFDWRLARWMLAGKLVLWPACAAAFIFADLHLLHLFPPRAHGLLFTLSAVPSAANIIAYATQLDLHATRAAAIVLASTLFAVIYLPAILLLARHFALIP